jgi:hypothetical protein
VEALEITHNHCCNNMRPYRGYGLCIENPKFVASVTDSRIDGYNDSSSDPLTDSYNDTGITSSVTEHSAANRSRGDWACPKWNLSNRFLAHCGANGSRGDWNLSLFSAHHCADSRSRGDWIAPYPLGRL